MKYVKYNYVKQVHEILYIPLKMIAFSLNSLPFVRTSEYLNICKR